MNLDEADMAPEIELNDIIWRSIRGADSPMPPPRRAAFVTVGRGDGDEADEHDEDEKSERADRREKQNRK